MKLLNDTQMQEFIVNGFVIVKQGIRILLGENFEEIVSFPTGSFSFGSNTDFGALLSA